MKKIIPQSTDKSQMASQCNAIITMQRHHRTSSLLHCPLASTKNESTFLQDWQHRH